MISEVPKTSNTMTNVKLPATAQDGKSDSKQRFSDLLVAVGNERDQAAFAEIYDHFAGRIKSFLMGKGMNEDTAEELMQEIMLIVWRRAESFDPSKAAASTWLFTIARNRRIDYLRGNTRVEVELDDAILQIENPDKSLDQNVIDAQNASLLEKAIKRLPIEQQQVMHLSFYRGQSHSTIAHWLELPVGTVKSRIRLGMQSVREYVQNHEESP